jgi:hypothetical protein
VGAGSCSDLCEGLWGIMGGYSVDSAFVGGGVVVKTVTGFFWGASEVIGGRCSGVGVLVSQLWVSGL